MSLEGPFQVNAAVKAVPLPHTKEELTKQIPRLRKLLWQREGTVLHTTAIGKSKHQGFSWVLVRNWGKPPQKKINHKD